MEKKKIKRAAVYARFSSSLQREESIDAQIRAIEEYADRNGYVIVETYIDRAFSATSDRRPEFQRMIEASGQGNFEYVIVHKLDRFARSRYDSAHYKYQLKKNGISLISVSENLDDSPESVVLESVLEGMAEYYSKNLAREVEKGKRENALKGRHVGGVPPLGYTVDPQTRQLVIEPTEAAAVQLIFKMFLDGSSYCEIRDELNRNGYRTKRGNSFGKNSLHEILRNEKYTGVYIYNKSAAKSVDGKYNRHASKSEDEIIRVEDALPALVTVADFQKVQQIFASRRHKGARFKAIEQYLLTGKIKCGLCGSAYVGNHRKAYEGHISYTSYRCSRKNHAIQCKSKEVERYWLEGKILHLLAHRVFDDALLPQIEEVYVQFLGERDKTIIGQKETVDARLRAVSKQIENIVTVVATTASVNLLGKLKELEQEQVILQNRMDEILRHQQEKALAGSALKNAFHQAKKMLAAGTLENQTALVSRFVKEVTVFPEYLEVKLNIVGGLEITETIKRESK